MSTAEPSPSDSEKLAVNRPVQAWLLAAIAGSADAICLLLYDAFAGQMTGNTVLLALDLFKTDWWSAAYHLALIGLFVLGLVGASAALRNAVSPGMVLIASAMLVATAVQLPMRAPALVVAAAMGLQNAAARRFGSLTLNTVFITGDLQAMASALTDEDAGPPARMAGRALAVLWASYLAGAVCGALLTRATSYPLLATAAAMPLVLLLGTGWWRQRVRVR